MKKSLQAWVEEVGQIEFPVFDRTLQALDDLQHAVPDVSGSKIASIVLQDPMMVLHAMRLANSGRSGRFSQPILTIEHAVMMLGLSPSLVKMTACKSLEATAPPEVCLGMSAVTARVNHSAFQARDWAVMRLDTNVEEVYIAALMQELGAMALWLAAPVVMAELAGLYRKLDRVEAEQQLLGFALDDLTLALAQVWNLPPLTPSSLQPLECEAHARVRLVAIARRLSQQTERGWYDEQTMQEIAMLAETLRVSEDEIAARVHRVAVETARLRVFEGVTPVAAWLPMLPGDWPEEGVDPASREVESPQAQTISAPSVDAYQHAMTQIAAQQDGTLNLNTLMTLVLRGMQQGLGLNRVVFALLTQDRKQLRARFVVGAEEGASLRQFQFALDQPMLFGKVLEKQQAFWLNDETRPKVERLLNVEIQRITATRHFFVMSIAVNGKVIGLFYADAGEGNYPLASDAYEKFRKLCAQTSVTMAHLAKS